MGYEYHSTAYYHFETCFILIQQLEAGACKGSFIVFDIRYILKMRQIAIFLS